MPKSINVELDAQAADYLGTIAERWGCSPAGAARAILEGRLTAPPPERPVLVRATRRPLKADHP